MIIQAADLSDKACTVYLFTHVENGGPRVVIITIFLSQSPGGAI